MPLFPDIGFADERKCRPNDPCIRWVKKVGEIGIGIIIIHPGTHFKDFSVNNTRPICAAHPLMPLKEGGHSVCIALRYYVPRERPPFLTKNVLSGAYHFHKWQKQINYKALGPTILKLLGRVTFCRSGDHRFQKLLPFKPLLVTLYSSSPPAASQSAMIQTSIHGQRMRIFRNIYFHCMERPPLLQQTVCRRSNLLVTETPMFTLELGRSPHFAVGT